MFVDIIINVKRGVEIVVVTDVMSSAIESKELNQYLCKFACELCVITGVEYYICFSVILEQFSIFTFRNN